MNDSSFLDLIETLDDMGSFTPEKLQASLIGALQTFQTVQSLIDSGDPIQKAEGIKKAQEMRKALEAQAAKLCKSMGIDPSQLEQLAQTETFSTKTKQILESTKEALERPEPKKKLRKTNKTWITG